MWQRLLMFPEAVRLASMCFLLLYASPLVAGSRIAKSYTMVTDGGGEDWNSARAACQSLNMTLASVDNISLAFLTSKTNLRYFQQRPTSHFWLGLYDGRVHAAPRSAEGFLWADSCEPVWKGLGLWEDRQPSARDHDRCVYAVNPTLKWRTGWCGARHQYLCQRREDRCEYSFITPACSLYVTSSKRVTVPGGTMAECLGHCERSRMESLPCWGFTLTSGACTLHFQPWQPECSLAKGTSASVVRTCFRLFYKDMPPRKTLTHAEAGMDFPVVPQCDLDLTTTEGLTAQPSTLPVTQTATRQPSPPLPPSSSSPTTTIPATRSSPTSASATSVPLSTDPSFVATPYKGLQLQSTEEPPTTAISTTASTTTMLPTSSFTTSKPPPSPPSSSPPSSPAPPKRPDKCPCRCNIVRLNGTAVLQEVAETKRNLSLDVRELSSTRRRRESAADVRVSSQRLAYVGLAVVAVAAAAVVLLDLSTLALQLRYGHRPPAPPGRGQGSTKRRRCQ